MWYLAGTSSLNCCPFNLPMFPQCNYSISMSLPQTATHWPHSAGAEPSRAKHQPLCVSPLLPTLAKFYLRLIPMWNLAEVSYLLQKLSGKRGQSNTGEGNLPGKCSFGISGYYCQARFSSSAENVSGDHRLSPTQIRTCSYLTRSRSQKMTDLAGSKSL